MLGDIRGWLKIIQSDLGHDMSKQNEELDQLIEAKDERDVMKEIIERHELNVMPLEIDALKKSLKQEKRNVLDLTKRIRKTAKERDDLKARVEAYEKSLDYGASVTIGSYQAKINELQKENVRLNNEYSKLVTTVANLGWETRELREDALIGWTIKGIMSNGGNNMLKELLKRELLYHGILNKQLEKEDKWWENIILKMELM